jgi:PLP dependent protein
VVKENLAFVEKNIEEACNRSGRKREQVTLIAVSKTKPVEMIKEAIDYGIVDFGENKVQEMINKASLIDKKVNWHLIGHLQRNKVKYIIDRSCLIHSVDSLRLATQIDLESKKSNIISNILIEVNIAKEESKFGVLPNDTMDLIIEISRMNNVKINGLMTIAPFVSNAEENRIYFRKLKDLNIDIKSKNIDNVGMEVLSMGMTGDYQVAIEEGATLIRVGTGIFGGRNYNLS